MNHKLTIIYTDKTEETAVYPSKEIAEEHEKGIHIALGTQIEFTCVMPTTDDVTVFEQKAGDIMIYQVNTFEVVGVGFMMLGTSTVTTDHIMITTDIEEAIAKGNECLEKGMNTEIVTWYGKTEWADEACVWSEDATNTRFADEGNGIVISVSLDIFRKWHTMAEA